MSSMEKNNPQMSQELQKKNEAKAALAQAFKKLPEDQIKKLLGLVKDILTTEEIEEIRNRELATAEKQVEKKEAVKITPLIEEIAKPEVVEKKEEAIKVYEQKDQEERLHRQLQLAGTDEKELASMKGWDRLSVGKKFLVLEQIQQHTLRNVKTLGQKRFEKENESASLLKKVWNNLRKSYWISKEEAKVIKETREGKQAPDKEAVKTFISQADQLEYDVEMKGDNIVIGFEKVPTTATEEQRAHIEDYNQKATAYAKMPDAWKNEAAANSVDDGFFKKQNHQKYIEARSAYEESRKWLVEYRKEQNVIENKDTKAASRDAMNEVKDKDFTIAALQFTQTSPDAASELGRIEEENSIGRFFNNENTARATYMALGFGMRRTLGIAAAPIVAGVMGGIRAVRKANQKINDATFEGRAQKTFIENKKQRLEVLQQKKDTTYVEPKVVKQGLLSKVFVGGNVTTKEIATFIDADSQIQRLSVIMEKFENASPNEKRELKSQLETRILYIEQKHKEGLINYGTENPTGTNYALLKTLAEAEVLASTYTEYSLDWEALKQTYIESITPETLSQLAQDPQLVFTKERLEHLQKIMQASLKETKATKRNFKSKEMVRGALVGAAFGVLGQKIHEWYSMLHHVNGVPRLTSEHMGVYHENAQPAGGGANMPSKTATEAVQPAHELPKVTVKSSIAKKLDLSKMFVPKDLDTNDTGMNVAVPNHDEVIKVDVPVDDTLTTPDGHIDTSMIDDGEGINHPIIESSEPIKVDTGIPPADNVTPPTATEALNTGNPSAVTTGDIAPMQRIYNTSGVADIAPNQPLGGTGAGIQLENNPYANIPNPHHLSREEAFNYKESTDMLHETQLTPENAWAHVQASPEKALATKDDLKEFFGKGNIEYESPDADEINGMSYTEWHTASDRLFSDNKFPFTSYDQYQKETTLQELFGHGEKKITEIHGSDGILRNAHTYSMQYFKKTPEWSIVEKVPARYLFDFNSPTMINGDAMPQDQLEKLVASGTLVDTTPGASGVHTYEFAHKKELLRLSRLYKEVVPKADRGLGNDKPIGDENIESYIARITKRIHKTINGTDYGIKDRAVAVDKIRRARLSIGGSLRIGNNTIQIAKSGSDIRVGFNNGGWY